MASRYTTFRVQLPHDIVREIYLYAQDHPEMTMGDVIAQGLVQMWEGEQWRPRPDARVRPRKAGRRMRPACPRDLVVIVDDN